MGVYITGVEMPRACQVCPLSHWNKLDQLTGCNLTRRYVPKDDEDFWNNDRPSWCPLIPVPPHGDLIGRDWLIDIALHLMNTAKNDDIANGVKWLWQYIIDAPTIIEAEGGEA